MRAEDTLQFMADFYPEIFPTRKHCLNYLFCVVGNGYKWVNGELVDDDCEYEKRYKLRKPIKKAEFKHEDNWNYQHKQWKVYKEVVGDVTQIPKKYQFEWYPFSKRYSALFTYPEDIKEDWKALLEECKSMLIADGIDLYNVD